MKLLKPIKLIFLLFVVCNTELYAQQVVEEVSQKVVEFDDNFANDEKKVIEFLHLYHTSSNDSLPVLYSPNELIIFAAKYLLDTPYVAQTLDVNDNERLVINLRELDCMTFVENCLALSRALQYSNPDYEYFVRQLKNIRYRDGIIQGYTSRLHYTTDWITNNVGKGVVEDITFGIGGKKFRPEVNFMSSHPKLYAALKNNPVNVEIMKEIENTINQRNTYYYIPKSEINAKQSLIKDGDIVCFTTNSPGLDISHLGIAYWNKSQLSFIHASSKHKKVIVNPESLSDYCTMIKGSTGIMILRPIPVNNQ